MILRTREERITFTVGVKTKNASNARIGMSRNAAFAEARENAAKRASARLATLAALHRSSVHPADLLPVVVTVTRISAGHLDAHDNLRSALKQVVDGIASALGIDDGSRFVEWRYAQQKAKPKTFGVEVRIEQMTLGGSTR